MADETTEKNDILGFDVTAKISIGDPSSRQTVDISKSITSVDFTFKNFTFLPIMIVKFTIDSNYMSSMANPYEMEIEIYEKGMGDTPRSSLSGKFFCTPHFSKMANIKDTNTDIVRFRRKEGFFPIDVAKTFAKDNSLVIQSSTVTSALNQTFNASAVGSCKLKLGTLSNSTSFRQIVLPWGRLQPHIMTLISTYGLSDLGLIAYSDFSNVYIHNANETLVGDSTPITMYFGELPTKEDGTPLISDSKYYTRFIPKVKTVGGQTESTYSSDVSVITYPRSGGYSTKTVNMENSAKKMKSTTKTDYFNYLDLYKTTQTQIHRTSDTSYPVESALARRSTTVYEINFTILEPFTFNDFIIGRRVEFDSTVTDFIGFNMGGYIDTVSYVLKSDSHNRWTGTAFLTVKCTSNGSEVV